MAATKPITDCPGGILSVGDMAGARHIVDRCIPMQRCCWGITAFVVAVSLQGLAARQMQHRYSVDGSGAFLLPAVPFTRVASFDNLNTGLSCAASPEGRLCAKERGLCQESPAYRTSLCVVLNSLRSLRSILVLRGEAVHYGGHRRRGRIGGRR